ncbi:MAG TPA: hypothetical protein VMX58_11125 [Patescibacteria group bacterium]|nr:hypothetical protein [Patescibacteria group bacterium]
MALEKTLKVLEAVAVKAVIDAVQQEAARKADEKRIYGSIEKHALYNAGEQAVDKLTALVNKFQSLHKTCGTQWDWFEVQSRKTPLEPENNHSHEREAETNRRQYKPSFKDKLFLRIQSKRKILDELVENSKRKDQTEYDNAMTRYKEENEQWSKLNTLSKRVLAAEGQAYMDAVRELNIMHNLEGVCKSCEVRLYKNNAIEVIFEAFGLEIVPKEKMKLLRSGKISFRDMPKGEYYEMYRDYVCSVTLRIAREFLAVLPIDIIIVTAMAELLNTSTGQIQQEPILSAAIARDTLKKINFELVRPSDCFSNFVHNMNFKRLSGFAGTTRLEFGRFANCPK